MTETYTSRGRTFPLLRGAEVIGSRVRCPLCAAEGHHTVSGGPIMLSRLADDPRLFCLGRHGYLSKKELASGPTSAIVDA